MIRKKDTRPESLFLGPLKAPQTRQRKNGTVPIKTGTVPFIFVKKQGAFTRQRKDGTGPIKSGTVPIIFVKKQWTFIRHTTEEKWHGSDKKWNGSNHFCKETVNFYPAHDRGKWHTTEEKWLTTEENGTGPIKSGTLPLIFVKKQWTFTRSATIGAYGPVAERIKVHCFFTKMIVIVPLFIGPVPSFLCRVNAPCFFTKMNETVPVFIGTVPFFLCRVNAP